MKSPFYNIYLYKYKLDASYESIERDLQQLGPQVQISVQDFSDRSAAECTRMIESIVTAERIRKYENGKQKECYVHVIRHTDERYVAIISVYPYGDFFPNLSNFFEILCHTDKIMRLTSGKTRRDCENFWRSYLHDFSGTSRVLKKTDFVLDGDEMFPIEIDDIHEIKEMFKSYPEQAKALLTCAFARVACAYNNSDSVIVDDIISNSKLNKMPVRVCNLTSAKPINDVAKAFSEASLYDELTYEEISTLCKTDISKFIYYNQAILYDGMYHSFFEKAVRGVVYQFDAIEYPYIPLMLVFHMDGEKPSLQFIYDRTFFRTISIEGLHKSFCITLSKLLNKDYTVVDYSSYIRKEASEETRRKEVIASCLKKSGWFENYDTSELIRLAEECNIKRLFLGQNFVDSGTSIDSVYLLINGKVEVVGRDMDNVLHSLQLIKEMQFFGIESITDKKVSSADYQVMTDVALAITIDRKVFLREAALNNDLFVRALELQNANVNKYQKLWMMS